MQTDKSSHYSYNSQCCTAAQCQQYDTLRLRVIGIPGQILVTFIKSAASPL